MKLWHKLLVLWIAAVLFNFLWGATIILQGGTMDDAKSATAPMSTVVMSILIISVFAMAKDKGMLEKSWHDERTQKISGRAFTYSWLATFLFVCTLVGLDAFNMLTVTVSQVLAIIFFFMLIASIMINWHYDKKGDVE